MGGLGAVSGALASPASRLEFFVLERQVGNVGCSALPIYEFLFPEISLCDETPLALLGDDETLGGQ